MADWDVGFEVDAARALAAQKGSAMQKRLVEIDAEIAKATGWGAKLTALLEERRTILRNLGYIK